MAGIRSGLAAKIINLESSALYTHCYGHALNLAEDMLKYIKVMERCLETVHEITKLIKQSPKRDSIFKNMKHDDSNDGQGMRLLCPTVRARVPYISFGELLGCCHGSYTERIQRSEQGSEELLLRWKNLISFMDLS